MLSRLSLGTQDEKALKEILLWSSFYEPCEAMPHIGSCLVLWWSDAPRLRPHFGKEVGVMSHGGTPVVSVPA